jgi:hypothetical protein
MIFSENRFPLFGIRLQGRGRTLYGRNHFEGRNEDTRNYNPRACGVRPFHYGVMTPAREGILVPIFQQAGCCVGCIHRLKQRVIKVSRQRATFSALGRRPTATADVPGQSGSSPGSPKASYRRVCKAAACTFMHLLPVRSSLCYRVALPRVV